MLDFLKGLFALNSSLLGKVRAVTAYDEALALHGNKEFKKALPLMTEAAELGHPDAMAVLGSMYLLGQGDKEDGVKATLWLDKAVAAGHIGADSILGMAYATGKAGVTIDLLKARRLLTAAAARGDLQSSRMLEMMDRGEGMFRTVRR